MNTTVSTQVSGKNRNAAFPVKEELDLASLSRTFRRIRFVVLLVSVFAVIQIAVAMMEAMHSQSQGIAGVQAAGGWLAWIRHNAILIGCVDMIISLGALLCVLIAVQRTRNRLTKAAGCLKDRADGLAASVSLLQATLESTADGIVAIDRQGQVSCCNQKFLTFWGLSEAAVRQKRAAELIALCAEQARNTEDCRNRLEALVNASQAVGIGEFDLADGRIVECFANPQRVGEERAGLVMSFREVTEQRRAEDELRRERYLLRALMCHSDDSIYFKDIESRFLRSTANMARRFQVQSADEMIGKRDADFFSEEHARDALADEARIIQTGQPVMGKVEKETWPDGHVTWALTSKMPLSDEDGKIVGTFGISKDITAIKETEARLSLVNKQLIDTSRQAGMAEVATSVLHNVGNVLNSVNVSGSLIAEKVRNSKAPNLAKIAAILQAHASDLGQFLAGDPKGKQVVEYIPQLSAHLAREQEELLKETGALLTNVVHIKEIVAMQQNYAKCSGVLELINVKDLVQDAVQMNNGAMDRHHVKLTCVLDEVPQILTDKHKVLQILINLLRNAKHACDDSGRVDKEITLRLARNNGHVAVSIVDNGVGIPAENLNRIFNHGFTTRKDGHGFGLHSGALAAKELGGSLTVKSEGRDRGAAFTLELPVKSPKKEG